MAVGNFVAKGGGKSLESVAGSGVKGEGTVIMENGQKTRKVRSAGRRFSSSTHFARAFYFCARITSRTVHCEFEGSRVLEPQVLGTYREVA